MRQLLLVLLFAVGPIMIAQDMSIELFLDKGDLSYRTPEGNHILDSGALSLGNTQEHNLKLINAEKTGKIKILSLQSTCSCIILPFNGPYELNVGANVSMPIKIDSSGYWGAITKSIYLRVQKSGQIFNLRIPVKFTVVDENNGIAPKDGSSGVIRQVRYVEYKGKASEVESDASAWLWASKNCSECEIIKTTLLPRILHAETNIPVVFLIDIDREDGLLLLLEVQKKIPKEEMGDFPALYYKNSLYYGFGEISKLAAAMDESYSDSKRIRDSAKEKLNLRNDIK